MIKKVYIFQILFCFLVLPLFSQQLFDMAVWESNLSIVGNNPSDAFSYSIAKGDINGDGFEDILAGAYYADPLGRNAAGTVYLILGDVQTSQQTTINLSNTNADVQIYGANSNDQLGKTVTILNVNNDNYDDILISAPYATANGNEASGKVYLILGGPALLSEYDLLLNEYDSVIYGENANDFLGISLAGADLNNDNYDEIIMGSPNADNEGINNSGKIYLIMGNLTLESSYNLANNDHDITILGENLNDYAGTTLQVGNFNNDIYLDLIIGAPQADPNGRGDAGKIYLIKGRNNFPNSIIDLSGSSDLNTTIYGGSISSNIGSTLAIGDINGDNNDDIIFSDLVANGNSGSVSILFGSNNLAAVFDLAVTSANVNIFGAAQGGILGEKVFSAKIDSDDISDVIIGIPSADIENGNDAGIIYIIYGSSGIVDQDLDSSNIPITILGASSGDNLGTSFSGININNDSNDDFIISAPNAENNRGTIYTIFGDLPFISNKYPFNDQEDLDVDTEVSFTLIDFIEGINLNSIQVNIAGTNYNINSPDFSQAPVENGYNITIIPAEEFGYDQIVDVTVDCNDNANWEMPTENYRFFTRADTDPPYTALWDPAPNEMDVSIETNINFHIYDAGQGVDINSVVVNVEGTNYYNGFPGFSFSGDDNDYFVEIVPQNIFDYNQVVNVTIDATDIGEFPNIMTTFAYEFTCGSDTEPPFVVIWDPQYNEEVARNYRLTVEIADAETGIDESSINFLLDDIDITASSTILPTANGFMISYLPNAANYYSYDTHEMRIQCNDNGSNANLLDESSLFICVEDTDPPFTINHHPEKYATEVATNTGFAVDILDLIMGVDESSISIILDGTEIMGLAGTIVSTITSGYHISYQPPSRLFGDISVSINCADLSDPPQDMIEENYIFSTSTDVDFPYLFNLQPEADEQIVPVNTNIYLEVHDDKTGVDQSSITLMVNNIDVTASVSFISLVDGVSLLFEAVENFNFNEVVTVQVLCSDMAVIPNTINESYFFTTESDINPPFVINQDPAVDEVGVALNRNIYLEIHDNELGVNESTIQILINGYAVSPQISALNENDFAILYDPPENFEFGDEITVSVLANDNAIPYNSLANYSYTFFCVDDDADPPFIWGINPAPNAINVDVNSTISFEILDEISGVDIGSLIFKVNNQIILDFISEEIIYSDTTGYLIQYSPAQPFQYFETVIVQIFVRDLSSNLNEMQTNYFFTCEGDTSAPELIVAFPEAESFGYPNTAFFFKFTDSQSGIDPTTLIVNLDNEIISPELMQIEMDEENSLEITYISPTLLDIEDDYFINLKLDDYLGNHQDTTYTISIVDDEFSPRILLLEPDENSFTLALNESMNLEILDKGMGINLQSILFKINGLEVTNYGLSANPYGLNPDSLGFALSYQFGESYYAGQFIQVQIYAEDQSPNANSVSETFSFHLYREELDEVTAIPSTITLNNDGINDVCRIWINSDKDLSNSRTKIFDRQGRLIRSLLIIHASQNRYYAEWNGEDTSNQQISAGLYIFQVDIAGKHVQGTIVVAK